MCITGALHVITDREDLVSPKESRRPNQAKLFYEIGELSGLSIRSANLDTVLSRIVAVIADHMGSEVCSIYLYAPETEDLMLTANTGLNPAKVRAVKLGLGEGLTGLALKELRPICERHASKNANFRYFPDLGEELYESFLAVPIHRGIHKIGVIVVQNTDVNYFSDEDIETLRAISSQVASIIELTNTMFEVDEGPHPSPGPISRELDPLIRGRVGAPGFVCAPAVAIEERTSLEAYRTIADGAAFNLEDFHAALRKSERQLEVFQEEVEKRLADVASLIFTAQILMLKDETYISAIETLIRNGTPVVDSIVSVSNEYVGRFEALADPYLRERAGDVRDIGTRVIQALLGGEADSAALEGKIVIAEELLPSDVLKLVSQGVKGIVLLSGGVTSHVCILAQSLNIPTIIADYPLLASLRRGTVALIDGGTGNLYIDPADHVIDSFRPHLDRKGEIGPDDAVAEESTTLDGVRVTVLANINLLSDLEIARSCRAEGIGLYRSEFPFVVRDDFPTEEEQYGVYTKLFEGMPGREISIRTLDIGGDKVLSYFDHHLKENNPYLGMRSIRFSLKHRDIFENQIRAILRAASNRPVRIMFPMISSVDEFLSAREILVSCQADLIRERHIETRELKVGMMIELPSVLEVIDDLAEEVDFFSVGTNDFIQYMLAVDRTNEKVADLYLPHHPSVLRALSRIIEAGNRHEIDVSICGDMVHEPAYLQLLIGLGIRKVSVNPSFIPRIKREINTVDCGYAAEMAREALAAKRISEIEAILKRIEKI